MSHNIHLNYNDNHYNTHHPAHKIVQPMKHQTMKACDNSQQMPNRRVHILLDSYSVYCKEMKNTNSLEGKWRLYSLGVNVVVH